jgi:hypothetical protein
LFLDEDRVTLGEAGEAVDGGNTGTCGRRQSGGPFVRGESARKRR